MTFEKPTAIRIILIAVLMAAFLNCLRNPYDPKASVGIPIVINEFMASNTGDDPEVQIFDEYGESDDWIELYNGGDDPINLIGLYLSDDSTDLLKFALPDAIISSHGHYLVWADNQTAQGGNHANFKLDAFAGDEIILSVIGGKQVDVIRFLAASPNPESRLPDNSYGRSGDGAATWCRQQTPTPGSKNSGCWEY
jgi:hypothetical protein